MIDDKRDGRVRTVVFADWDHWVPQQLVSALLPLAADRKGLEITTVCVPRDYHHRASMARYYRRRLKGGARRLLLGDRPTLGPPPVNLWRLASQFGFDVVVPRDPRHPQTDPRWDVLLSLFWKYKFDGDLLAGFRQAINYHNGLVPDYRGLRATPWSIYRGETRSGFTVHHISERLDAGNVLITDSVEIRPDDTVRDVELRKTRRAIESLPAVLDAVEHAQLGTPQPAPERYNRVQDIERLKRIEDPGDVDSVELLRRIRAFGPVTALVRGEIVTISGLGAGPAQDPIDQSWLRLKDGYWRLTAGDRTRRTVKRLMRHFSGKTGAA